MAENDGLDFTLEDILREFSDNPQDPPQDPPPAPPAEPKRVEPQLSGDTQPITVPSEAVRTYTPGDTPKRRETMIPGDTIRMEPVRPQGKPEPAMEETQAFAPVGQQDPEPHPVEPFSDEWEPDYGEGVEDYSVPEPIVFRPKSRLRELRQKLVAGPEQRYYALSELGLGKLQAAMVLNVILLLLCAGATALYAWGIIPDERLRLLVFAQFLATLLSALVGCYRLIDGVGDLLKLRFTPNTLLVVSFCVCCVDGVLCLQELRLSCCAAFCLQMTMALWAAYDRRNTEMGQMDTLRRTVNLEGIARVENDYEGRPGYRMCRGEVEHFMDHYDGQSQPDKLLGWFAVAVLVVSLVIAIVGGVLHGFSMGVQLCCAGLMVGMPATAFLATARPAAVLEKRLHKLGTVLCGWQGVEAVSHRSVFTLTDDDLFPAGAAKLNGVKFYGDRDRDLVVSYAAALIRENGGSLVELFTRLRDERGGYPYTVENLNHYAGGGIGGEIDDDAVLVGTLRFMQDMGVEMGQGTQVNQAVYVAIDGELCGVFAVAYGKARSSAAGIRTLCGYSGLTPVLLARDFMLTESFVRARFGVNTRRMAFPGRQVREELAQRECEENATVVALTTKPGLAPRAFAITGARVLKNAMQTGVYIHMAGGIIGLSIMAALAYVGAAELLTPINILLYNLVWMIPGFIVTEWTRTI